MDYNDFRKKIYYIDLREILIYVFFTLLIYILVITFSFINKNGAFDLFKIIELIILFILLIISIYAKSITQEEIYGVAQLFLIINFIKILVFLSQEEQFIFFKKLIRNIGFNDNCDFSYISIVIFYYIISKCRKKLSNNKGIYIEYIVLFLLSIGQTYLFYKYSIWGIYILHILFIASIIFLTIRNLYGLKYNSNGKIDLMKLNLLFEVIRFIFIILSKIVVIPTLSSLTLVIMQTFLLATMIGIIINTTKEVYRFIFKETIMRNNYLEGINKKIINNNYKLEDTYKKLYDKQKIYKSLLGSFPNPIVIINSSYIITYCNYKFLKEIGEENIRDVVNRRIDIYIKFNNKINKVLLNNDNSEKPNTTNIDLNNKKIEVRFFNLNNDDSEYVLIFKDLTEEIKLLDMKEELEEIKVKEKIKKNFLSNISHDLKIPINIIYSAIQLEKILIDRNDIIKVKSYNDISMENCITLTKLTNNIIDISKIDAEDIIINLGLYNIVEFIEDYLNSLSLYIKNSGLDIIFDTSKEEIYIHFDKEMMQRVILNLVSNSVKFTEKGGRIFVSIEDFNDYVLIEFADSGIGMSEEFISKAFNKYEKEKININNNSTGFGVGLFVVYNLIKFQNGSIEIKSKINKGTSFYIKIYKKKDVINGE